MITKTFCCDESKRTFVNEIDQDTPASSDSQFEEPGLKRMVIIENKIPSAIYFSKSIFQNMSLLWGSLGSFA